MRYVLNCRSDNKLSIITNFYIGDYVYVTDTGGVYTYYDDAYNSLGLDMRMVPQSHYPYTTHISYFKPFKVVGFIFHEKFDDLLVGLKNEDGNVVISYHNVKKAHLFGVPEFDVHETIAFDNERLNAECFSDRFKRIFQ